MPPETSAAAAPSASTSAPQPSTAPQLLPPKVGPGPIQKGGPEYSHTAGPNPQEIQKQWAADREARKATVLGKVFEAPASTETETAAPDVEADATALLAQEEANAAAEAAATKAREEAGPPEPPEGASQGKDPTAEQTRIERVEAAAAKAKADSRRFREQRAHSERTAAHNAQLRQQNAQLQQQAQRAAALEAAIRQDPLKAIERFGVTPEILAQRALMAGTPEEKFAVLQQQLEAERSARLNAEKAQQERQQRELHDAGMKSAQDKFVKRAANAERYPNLQGMPSEFLLALGLDVAQKARARYLRETGTVPEISDRKILTYLDQKYAKAKAPSTAAPKAAQATPKAAKQTGTGSPKPVSPRTVTSSQTTGASWSRPANFKSLPQAERMKILKKQFPGT